MANLLSPLPLMTQPKRRRFIRSALAISGMASLPSFALELWPSRPLQLTVVGAAGSPPDTVARDLVERIGGALGQPIVVENSVGGAGIIGMEKVHRAPPNGHHFVFTHVGAVVINPSLFKSLPYDPVRDFDPVSLILTGPMILVASASSGIDSLKQLIELARRNPGTLMYGSAGIGGPSHVFTEQFKAATQLSLDHVPFKGAPGLVMGLLGSQVPVGMESATALLPSIQAGKVRPLAVSGTARMGLLPEIPTFDELGIPGIGVSWMAVMAPKGTPLEAVSGLNRELTRVLALPDLIRAWSALGRQVAGGAPEVLAARIQTELPLWRDTIESAGIRPE